MSVDQQFNYFMPTRVRFGWGELDRIGEAVAGLGTKALLVTGRSAMQKLGFTDLVVNALQTVDIETVIYNKVEPNPSVTTVDEGAALAKELGCDFVIGLGGGSPLDAAKAIAAVMAAGGSVWELIKGERAVPPVVPLVAVPSTAGTGSEVTQYALVSNKDAQEKFPLRSPYLFPTVAIVDPAVMATQTPELTAETGMDALTHAIEAMVGNSATPLGDLFAAEAIRYIARHIVTAVRQGDDREARAGMAYGSMLAGVAIAQAGTGAAHGIGQAVGGIFDTGHGATVGILLPHVMEFNLTTRMAKYAYIARLLGAKVDGLNEEQTARAGVDYVHKLLADVGLPSGLDGLGVSKEAREEIVIAARPQGGIRNNPRRMEDEDVRKLLNAVLA
ncbi:MAG TPA: iron-containing alcohol dehydrogenase [Firmicutes bacterium]|jgi:alcohol dehydrogenase|nr:iron-containing alcohol dehydrogenase [Bacillota bacterium]